MIDTASTIREALDAGLNLQALDLARSASSGDATSAEIPLPRRAGLGAHGRDRRSGKIAGGRSTAMRSAAARSPSRCGAWPAGSPRNDSPRHATGRARPHANTRRGPSRTTAMRTPSAATRIPPSTRRRWRCSPATRRGRAALAQQALSAMRPDGRPLAPRDRGRGAARCSIASTRPAPATPKRIGWPAAASATSRRCGGNCG